MVLSTQMLRSLEKQRHKPVRNPNMIRGTSWAPKKLMKNMEMDEDFSSEESTPRHSSFLDKESKMPSPAKNKDVAFGTTVPDNNHEAVAR